MLAHSQSHDHEQRSTPLALLLVSVATLLIAAGSYGFAKELTPTEIENRRCLNCHGQSRIGEMGASERASMLAPATQPSSSSAATSLDPAPRPGIYIAPDALDGSVHATLACADCHQAARTLPHPAELGKPTCNSTCHVAPRSDYLQGAHAEAVARGVENAPTCVTCHGGHDILRSTRRESRTFPLNIVKICGDCHRTHTSANGKDGNGHIEHYLESVHGKAVTQGGLAVAATCADCHGNHRVLPSDDERSKVNRANVVSTCGTCHIGLAETFAQSVHGQELAKGNEKAPVCTDCHTAHQITRVDTPAFKLDIVAECGQCHDQPIKGSNTGVSLIDTYRRSYHGQVTTLGSTRAARCSDCHGAHDIQRLDNPASRLYGENRVQTCRQCHKEATEQFAAFEAHADYRDRHRYPVLYGVWMYFVVMMSLAFGFFGLHSILWFGRSVIDRFRHGPPPKIDHHGPSIQRFNRVDRVNHAFVIISFFGLTLTGLPLLFADQAWAKTLAGLLGGVRACGILHRGFAIILIGNFVVHFVGLVRRFKRLGFKQMLFGPVTMLPRKKDIADCIGMFRWFFVGGKKPKFDRWTYWEKFDYVAEVGGSGIIGLTGLMLWFPEFFSQFLPGWMFNVANIVHGYEALLAIGFIFTIHFFNAHLRLEKFPVDNVMFTGRLPEDEFKHERQAEYERLKANGQLDALRVAPPPGWYRWFALAMGILAMAIGTTLVVLIVLAGLKAI